MSGSGPPVLGPLQQGKVMLTKQSVLGEKSLLWMESL
jgi:hypothetical protein